MVARSVCGRLLFEDDADRLDYLARLKAEAEARGWKILAFCLMSNHIHILLLTPEADLHLGMQVLQSTYATSVNRKRAQVGHLFDGRFKNRLVTTDRYYGAVLRYIARNPVKARMCDRVEDWAWSAHRELAAMAPPGLVDVDTALGILGLTPESYIEFVGQSDEQIMRDLRARTAGDTWLIAARDEHQIAPADIAAFLGISERTLRRRLARARDGRQGSDP